MHLLEHEAKSLMSGLGVRVPRGVVLSRRDGREDMVNKVRTLFGNAHVMVKAQVPSGGRGKRGGVVRACGPGEAVTLAASMLENGLAGEEVASVLIEEHMAADEELFLSITIDPIERAAIVLASREGGTDVEVSGNGISRSPLNSGPDRVAEHLGLHGARSRTFMRLFEGLTNTFREKDLTLLELNPLVFDGDDLVALDAKMIVDDNALFRQEVMKELSLARLLPSERKAKEADITFLRFGGDIGIIANGAGLTMATMDAIEDEGGKVGVFLDLGGTDDESRVARCLSLIYDTAPSVVVINNFGGITKSDTVARAIIDVMNRRGRRFPIVARLRGNAEEEARNILKDAGIIAVLTLEEAARRAVALQKDGGGD